MKLKFGTKEGQFNQWLKDRINEISGGFAKKIAGSVLNSGHLDHYGLYKGAAFFLEQKFVHIGPKARDTTVLVGGPEGCHKSAKTWTPNQIKFLSDLMTSVKNKGGGIPCCLLAGGLVAVSHPDFDLILGALPMFIMESCTMHVGPVIVAGTIMNWMNWHFTMKEYPFIMLDNQGRYSSSYNSLEQLLDNMTRRM